MTSAGLLTRNQFLDTIKELLQCDQKNKPGYAVFVIGINRFKKINMLYGITNADTILDMMAQRILEVLPEGHVISKIANSEFALLLKNLNHSGQLILAINKILTLLDAPFILPEHEVQIKISIGICTSHPTITRADDYILHAETALKLAKQSNADYLFYSDEFNDNANLHTDIESKINLALEENEFELYYQPKVNLKSGLPIGAEALIRWNSPALGQLSPNLFIPIAEQTGQIIPMTFWVLNTALRQLREWPITVPKLNVAINFSAVTTKEEDLVDKVQNALKIWDIDYTQLTIEITESSLLTDQQKTFEILKKLKDLGVKISIDDFGTGYSSLSYFKNIPASELKIDQSFVSKVLTNKTDRQIIKTIIAIAKEFSLQVTAEGIEDEETYNVLLDLGCDIGQGFFMGRPMPLGKFIEWLNHASLTPFSFCSSPLSNHKPSQLY